MSELNELFCRFVSPFPAIAGDFQLLSSFEATAAIMCVWICRVYLISCYQKEHHMDSFSVVKECIGRWLANSFWTIIAQSAVYFCQNIRKESMFCLIVSCFEWFIDRSISRSVGRSVGRLVGCFEVFIKFSRMKRMEQRRNYHRCRRCKWPGPATSRGTLRQLN